MNIKSHTYEDIIFAQFYDFIVEKLNRGNAGKEAWEFITYCAKIFGSPILEMGCGTGINLLELAEMGYTVTGLDNSPAMLKILEQKLTQAKSEIRQNVAFIEGDMVNPSLKRSDFRLILFPQAQFLHLQSDEQRLNCLQNTRRLLAEDGVALIFNGRLQKLETWEEFREVGDNRNDQWELFMRRTFQHGEFHEEFQLISKSQPKKEYLFDWRLYPMEDERLMQLIEKAGLRPSPVPTDLPINFHERFKKCAFSR